MKKINLKELRQRDFSADDIYKMLRSNSIWMSWGIHNPWRIWDNLLFFKVQGFLHKGYVMITLDFDDTFTITLTRANRINVVKEISWVYIEDLLNVIDINVEKEVSKEEYKKLIEKAYNLK